MPKNMIIEAQNSNTAFEEGNKKGVLGKLAGVFADFKNGTRNANRLYNEKLWDRVLNSEDVEEAMNTKTLFGELDHPEGERCESLAQNAAITITKLEKRPEEGVIYGEAEILDTPTGRIVKALADSGAQLGISSRGMGEEVMIDGQNTIDPDTYDFITFDVVVTPANEKARVSLTEGKHLSKLNESLKKEIKECETENQLNQVKAVVENMSISNKDEMLGLIEEKLEAVKPIEETPIEETPVEPEKKEENVKLSNANKAIAYKLLETKYAELSNKLEESTEQINKLNKSKELLNKTIKSNVNKLKEAKELNDKLTEENSKLVEAKELEIQKGKTIVTKVSSVNKRKFESLEEKHEEDIEKLNEELTQEKEKVTKIEEKYNNLSNANKKLAESLKATNSLLEEKDNTIKKLDEELKLQQANSAKKLQESKQLEESVTTKLRNEINKLVKENKQLKEENAQYTDLMFTPTQSLVKKEESLDINEDFDDEDKALLGALIN